MPDIFTPLQIKSKELKNRIVMGAAERAGFTYEDGLIPRMANKAVRACAAAPFSVLHSIFEHRFDLSAGIASIKLVHDIQKRGKIIFYRIGAVHTIVDSNETNTLVRKDHFGVKTYLEIIPSETAHVLYQNNRHIARIDFVQHSVEARSIEVCPEVVR